MGFVVDAIGLEQIAGQIGHATQEEAFDFRADDRRARNEQRIVPRDEATRFVFGRGIDGVDHGPLHIATGEARVLNEADRIGTTWYSGFDQGRCTRGVGDEPRRVVQFKDCVGQNRRRQSQARTSMAAFMA